MVKKPRQIPPRTRLDSEQIERAVYKGSPEHKVLRWWGGLPEAYRDANGIARRFGGEDTTICPLTTETQRGLATSWVRSALTAGTYRYREGDKDFPKHIWYRDDAGTIWFGFCTNGVLGQYKGWPIDEDEWRAIFG